MSSYNGWENWETWNVSLWIANDEYLYHQVVRYARGAVNPSFNDFIRSEGLENFVTPDGVAFTDDNLGLEELDEFVEAFEND